MKTIRQMLAAVSVLIGAWFLKLATSADADLVVQMMAEAWTDWRTEKGLTPDEALAVLGARVKDAPQ